MEISKSGLKKGNPLDCLKLCFHLDKETLVELFEKVKIQVKDEKDLEILSKIVEKKFDVQGQFRDPNDENIPLMFDTMAILNSIEFTPEQKEVAKKFKYNA